MNKYKPVIGLEIHVELKTQSKMFCQCKANYFGKPPNSQVCPVCLGMPGALPVPNNKAVEWTILIGKALNCKINKVSKFDRKHYFYPDLPKGYQISQYDEPIAVNGKLSIDIDVINHVSTKTFRIRRVHLEEDTGKLLHVGNETLVDFNRSGVPLVEIVTEPEFDNADDVKRFLEELQVIVRYLDVADADMEKGSMRLEPNISVATVSLRGALATKQSRKDEIASLPPVARNDNEIKLPSYKVEVKNINSFRFVKQAIEYEIGRQTEILEKEEMPIQETRGFDSNKQITYSQRTKEEAQDYRYFPEPDIPPMSFDDRYLQSIVNQIPELPQQKLDRYVNVMNLRYQDAFTLTRNKKLASYFEAIIKSTMSIPQFNIKDQTIANLIINKKIALDLTDEQIQFQLKNLYEPRITDDKLLDTSINRIIETNKKVVDDYKKGKVNAIMFLVGQVMREMKGKADANMVKEKLIEKMKTK